MEELSKYKMGEFWNKLLSAVAMAIVVAVTPEQLFHLLSQD